MSGATDWAELKCELLELLQQTHDERSATLARLRRDVPRRAAELERLLAAADSEFLETPAWSRVAVPGMPQTVPPERVGPWRIEAEIGRGGMGTVYRARRDDGAFDQIVAIKLIRPELASAQLRRRFDSERNIQASLDHPNIARLLDAGTTADGAPYLVLEFVAGEPVDRYCDAQALDVEQRLSLFRQVCGAVHVAHLKLILHRDIKSANVLVDAQGVPKLLDFGIAKLLAPQLEGGDLTMVGFARPLTPEWSSPEQLRSEPLSMASDVYSLGVLLFLLLTGRRPHLFTGNSPDGFAAAIESTRLPDLRSAAHDHLPPGIVLKKLRGDIEHIVRKALQPDLRERYQTVAALDADIGRLLSARPIEARAPSYAYRFGKLVRRQRAATIAVLLATVGLLAATAYSLRQESIAERERERAERRFADVRRIANVVLFDLNDTLANISGTLAVRQLLVENALRYLDSLARDTGREPELLIELATAYERIAEVQGMPSWPSQGRTGDALTSLSRALEFHRRAAAAGTLSASSALAEPRVLTNMGSILAARGDSRAALDAQRRSEAALDQIAAGARSGDWLLLLARVRVAAGDAIWELGDIAAAAREYQRALTAAREGQARPADSGAFERQIGVVEQRLGDAAAAIGDWPAARPHHAASLAVDEALLGRDPSSLELQRDLGTDWSRVGVTAFMLGEHKAALAAHDKALALRTRLAMADPTDARAQDDAAESHLQLAQSLAGLGRIIEARNAASRAVEAWRKLVELDPANARLSSSLAKGLVSMARCESALGRRTAALSRIAAARTIRRQLAAEHPDFRMRDDAFVELDALDATIRAGAAPPQPFAVADAWQN